MSEQLTSEWEHRIIDGISYAIYQTEHSLGLGDNAWLRSQIENGPSDDKLKTAVEIAVAFLHFSQDKKSQLTAAQSEAVAANQQVLVLAAANEKLTEQNHNLCLLVVRLARRVRFFEKGSDVATKALDYLSRNGLMPSVLREEKK